MSDLPRKLKWLAGKSPSLIGNTSAHLSSYFPASHVSFQEAIAHFTVAQGKGVSEIPIVKMEY